MDKQAYAILGIFAFILATVAALLTHVIVCIKAANYLFLIAGALVPVVGIIHGFGLWIGAW